MMRIKSIWVSLALAILSISLIFFAAEMQALLYFDRDLLRQGQIWRLITGHLVHADRVHLLWNVVALVLLSGVIERASRRLLLFSLLSGVVAVDVLLLSAWSDIDYYCGLSGVLNSVLVVTLWVVWQQSRSHWVSVTAVLCLGKILLEITLNDTVISHISWPPYPLAHLAGAIGGVFTLLLWGCASNSAKLELSLHN